METRYVEYFKALKREIQTFAEDNEKQTVRSVFIGGGTPSLPESSFISDVMETINKNFKIEENAEISIESNPGTLSFEKLSAYKNAGINRLSIGLQAWQDRLLKSIGRIHDREQFFDNFGQARSAGFKNINADIIFGLPTQNEEDWNETLNGVLSLDCEHISCYSLSIEKETIFHKMLEGKKLQKVSDETDRNMYHTAIKAFKKKGYRHYEISNFAKEGFQCKHNLIYWNAEEYLGLGAGAHSYFKDERFSNPNGIDEYIKAIKTGADHKENICKIDPEESMAEYMILGLRLIDGVCNENFQKRYNKNISDIYKKQIEKLFMKKLIIVDDKCVKLTKLGLDLANQVFTEFV
jgi:oxygen-independent coproporphyrinogen-3 oxidase